MSIHLSIFKRTMLVGVFLVAAFLYTAIAVHAEEKTNLEPGALTPPPPAEHMGNGLEVTQAMVGTQSTNFIYDSWNQISLHKSNIIRISGTTLSSQIVDKLTIDIYIQRWDGSKWVSVMHGGTASNTNRSSLSGTQSFSVTRGYYYRGRTVHKAHKGSIGDFITKYSGSMLAPL